MTEYSYTVVLERDDDGRILALCPALQGCYTDGDTEAEAMANIREAIQAHIESRILLGEEIPGELRSERVTLVV